MLEVLNFIFSSFWTWVGTFLMLGVIASAFNGLITKVSYTRK